MGMTMTQKILAAHAGLDSVEAGQLIGYVGTFRSDGFESGYEHLHFEILQNDQRFDPTEFINKFKK